MGISQSLLRNQDKRLDQEGINSDGENSNIIGLDRKPNNVDSTKNNTITNAQNINKITDPVGSIDTQDTLNKDIISQDKKTFIPINSIKSELYDIYHPNLFFLFDLNQFTSHPETLYWPTKILNFSGIIGFVNGFWLGYGQRSVQFLAENAHRQPKTRAGWYLYQRKKHQEVLSYGISKGFRMSSKVMLISFSFLSIERLSEIFLTKNEQSFINPLISSTIVSLLVSRSLKLDLPYTKRVLKVSLLGSLIYSTLIESYTYIYGTSLKYPYENTDKAFYIPYELKTDPKLIKSFKQYWNDYIVNQFNLSNKYEFKNINENNNEKLNNMYNKNGFYIPVKV